MPRSIFVMQERHRHGAKLAGGFPGACGAQNVLACSGSAACYTTSVQPTHSVARVLDRYSFVCPLATGHCVDPGGQIFADSCGELTRNLHQVRQEALEVASKEASIISFAATHALSFVFFPGWIRSHPHFETLGPLNLISDSMEACEQIMLRGEAEFLLCHYHREAFARFEPSQFTSIVVGKDVLVPLCARDANGAPKWPWPESSPLRFLSYSPQSGLGRILNAVWSKDKPLSLKNVFTAQLAVTLLSMARQGHGIAWLPETLAAEDIAAGRLVDPAQGRFSIDVDIRLIRPVHRQPRTAEAFWKAVCNNTTRK